MRFTHIPIILVLISGPVLSSCRKGEASPPQEQASPATETVPHLSYDGCPPDAVSYMGGVFCMRASPEYTPFGDLVAGIRVIWFTGPEARFRITLYPRNGVPLADAIGPNTTQNILETLPILGGYYYLSQVEWEDENFWIGRSLVASDQWIIECLGPEVHTTPEPGNEALDLCRGLSLPH